MKFHRMEKKVLACSSKERQNRNRVNIAVENIEVAQEEFRYLGSKIKPYGRKE